MKGNFFNYRTQKIEVYVAGVFFSENLSSEISITICKHFVTSLELTKERQMYESILFESKKKHLSCT